MDAALSTPSKAPGVWRLDWLTPWRCRLILVAVLAAGFAGHANYLFNNCPLDLSGDEAYYWDWSRQLDVGYYSKGPMVAYLIRASCAIFGDTMPGVRLPALFLAIGTSLATYWLTRRLFGSERLALGAVLLNHFVPMFIAGSVLMTIDPPFFFFWALATCFTAKAVFDEQPKAWLGMGVALGLGLLSKYGMFLWVPGLLAFLLIDREGRRHLRSPWLWAGLVVGLVFLIPPAIWNARHGWVSALHVAEDTGAESGRFFLLNSLEMIGGQIGILGPALAIIIIGAVAYAIRGQRNGEPQRRGMLLLLCIGMTYLTIVFLNSFRTKIQMNWPAPAYFTLMILAAYFLGTRLQSAAMWRRWRGWLWGTVGFGLLCMPLSHDPAFLYGPVKWVGKQLSKKPSEKWTHARWDPTYRLRGWQEAGQFVSQQLKTLSPGAFVMTERYDNAGLMAFYVEGQPKTYSVGSWFLDPKRRARLSQYDIWPDRQLDRRELIGRDAVYLGPGQRANPLQAPEDLVNAFERVDSIQKLEISRGGIAIRTFTIWRCHGFKGMKRPEAVQF